MTLKRGPYRVILRSTAEGYVREFDREQAADLGAELLGSPQPTNVTRMRRSKE
jgi:hypothetical protein